jgi:sugar phosphate isomerase/epimerase
MAARMIPGVVSATFKTEPPTFVLEQAVKNGLEAVEWSENAHIEPGNVPAARALRCETEKAGLRVAAYGSYYRLGENEDPAAAFAGSLRSAEALGAPLIRLWAGTKPSAKVNGETRRRLAEEAALLAKMAGASCIRLAFEWHKNTLTDTNESALQLLQDADSDNLYCLWQPTVALSMAERCAGVRLLGDRLLNFHVYYWLDGVRRPLAEGRGEWLAYLQEFQGGPGHCALLEFVMGNTPTQFAQDASALKQLLTEAGRA